MALITAQKLITNALRDIGVIASHEVPSAEDTDTALTYLNDMLEQWNLEKLMAYYEINELFTLTPDQNTYWIGNATPVPTDYPVFSTTRPFQIKNVFCRIMDGSGAQKPDIRVEVVPNSKFQDIVVKNVHASIPSYLNYTAMYPYGQIRLFPYPSAAHILGMTQRVQFNAFPDLTTEIDLPMGYAGALKYSLEVELCTPYNVTITQRMQQNADDYKANIRRANRQADEVKIDFALRGKGIYNIQTDSWTR